MFTVIDLVSSIPGGTRANGYWIWDYCDGRLKPTAMYTMPAYSENCVPSVGWLTLTGQSRLKAEGIQSAELLQVKGHRIRAVDARPTR